MDTALATANGLHADQFSRDSDPNYDYIFYIPIDLYSDPHGARWFTDDFALWLATGQGGSLNGMGYSHFEVRLGSGDGTLIAAGFWGSNAGAEAAWHIFGRYQ